MTVAQTKIDRSRNMAPLDVDGVKTFKIGTAAFVIALIVCLALNQGLTEHGQQWWIWTCVTGIVIGLLGIVYTTRRSKVYAEAREANEAQLASELANHGESAGENK